MAFFGGSEKVVAKKSSSTVSVITSKADATVVTKCMEIKGDLNGCGAIQIDGTIYGDLNIEDSVTIGESGSVHGNIRSKKVLISGELDGSLKCDDLEVTTTGSVTNKIEAKTIVSDGHIEAYILSEDSIHITQNGKVKTEKMQSKHITVNGFIEGNVISSELLEINHSGAVKGKMVVKNIKTEEGGSMLGTMSTYEEVVHTKTSGSEQKDEFFDEKSISNSKLEA